MDRGLDRRGRREERKQSLYIYLTSTSVNWRAGRQFRILRRRIPPQDCKRNDRANSFAAHFSTEALISTSRARDIPWMKAFVRGEGEPRTTSFENIGPFSPRGNVSLSRPWIPEIHHCARLETGTEVCSSCYAITPSVYAFEFTYTFPKENVYIFLNCCKSVDGTLEASSGDTNCHT